MISKIKALKEDLEKKKKKYRIRRRTWKYCSSESKSTGHKEDGKERDRGFSMEEVGE